MRSPRAAPLGVIPRRGVAELLRIEEAIAAQVRRFERGLHDSREQGITAMFAKFERRFELARCVRLLVKQSEEPIGFSDRSRLPEDFAKTA